MYTSSFYIKKIIGLEDKSLKEISRFLFSYNEKREYGFLETTFFNDFIESTLVYKSIINQRIFEPSNGQFKNSQQSIYEQVTFELYPEQRLLQVYEGERKTQNTILYLSNAFRQKIVFEDIFADIPQILRKITKSKIRYSILNFALKNFRPQEGVIGKFTPSVSDTKVAQTIIDDYKGDILSIQLKIEGVDVVYWYITSNGKISVKSSTTNGLQENIQTVKMLVAGK